QNNELRESFQNIQSHILKTNSDLKKMGLDLRQVSTLETKINSQQQHIEGIQKKSLYMEDSLRCTNIKLINFNVHKTTELKQE
ncbi:hypothetical protein JRQ81_019466, partial [Phrynocephalus forsythii]